MTPHCFPSAGVSPKRGGGKRSQQNSAGVKFKLVCNGNLVDWDQSTIRLNEYIDESSQTEYVRKVAEILIRAGEARAAAYIRAQTAHQGPDPFEEDDQERLNSCLHLDPKINLFMKMAWKKAAYT